MEEAKNVLKNLFVRFIKPFLMTLLVVVLIFSLVTTLLAAAAYFIFVWVDGIGEDDWSNPSYASSQYSSNITVSKDGTISSNMTAQEIWDEMIANGSRVDLYLDGPEELARLMNAELVTQLPDMRENPNEEIDWGEVEDGNIQGIIKFRRADNDGTVKTLSYVEPDEFFHLIEQYNITGSEQDRSAALSHFTIKKGSSGASGSINYNGPNLCWPVEPNFVTITSPFGYRVAPTAGATSFHGGIDIGDGGINGTNAYACEKGTVIATGNDGSYNYGIGNHVIIDHGNGYVSKYYHLQTGSVVVQVGDEVEKGQAVGSVGTTGASTGPHLHFQIDFNDTPIDPMTFKYSNGQGSGTGGFGDYEEDEEESETTEESGENSENAEEEGEENPEENNENENEEDTEESGIDISKLYFIGDSWINGLETKGIADTTYFHGEDGVTADTISAIPDCSAASALVLHLGLNNPSDTKSMEALIDQLVNVYPDKKIYVVEVSHVASGYVGDLTASELNNAIDTYNETIKNYCNNKENVKFLEVASNIEGSDGWLKYADSSNYHLTDEGYKIWYDSIISAIGGDTPNSTSTSTRKTPGYYAVVATWTQVDASFTWTDDNWEQATEDIGIDVVADGEAEEGTNEEVAVVNGTMTSSKSTMSFTNVNYEEYVQNLTMPFDLLWSLLVISEDKSFVFDLADLAYNSTIEITVFDNITIDTNIDNWTYGYQEKMEVEGSVKVTGGNVSTEAQVEKHEHEGEPDPIMGGGQQTESTDGENTENSNNGEATSETQAGFLNLKPSSVDVLSNKKIAALTSDWWDEDEGTLLDQEPPTQEEVEDIINGENNTNNENEEGEENSNKEESAVEHTGDRVDDVSYYYVNNEVVTTTNTVTVALTRADVWMMDYRQEYTLSVDKVSNNNGTLRPEDQEYKYLETVKAKDDFSCCDIVEDAEEEALKKWSEERRENGIGQGADMNVVPNTTKDIDIKYYYRYIGQTDNTTNKTETKKYIKGVPIITEKVDKKTTPNFVTLFNESDRMGTRSNIRSASSWLFEIMEHKESTSGTILDLIKYLLYKATDTDYGVTEFSFESLLEMQQSTMYGTISGNSNAEKVWNYFKSVGFSDETTAAIMGNLSGESNFDPTSIQSGGRGPGAGIAQWENYNTKSDRWEDLYNFATGRGKEWTDLQCQLDFLMSEAEACFTEYTGAIYVYDNGTVTWWPDEMTLDEFKSITDINLATEIFCRVYERPSVPNMPHRIEEANKIYNTYHGQ